MAQGAANDLSSNVNSLDQARRNVKCSSRFRFKAQETATAMLPDWEFSVSEKFASNPEVPGPTRERKSISALQAQVACDPQHNTHNQFFGFWFRGSSAGLA